MITTTIESDFEIDGYEITDSDDSYRGQPEQQIITNFAASMTVGFK